MKRWRRIGWGVVFVGPAAALYGAFVAYPLVATVVWSFYSWVGTVPTGFAGLANYAALVTTYPFNEDLLPAARNNGVFLLGTMILQNGFGLLLAVLLRVQRRFRNLLQAVFALPYMLSPLIIGYLWSLLLNPVFGPVQGVMAAVGAESLYAPWLGQESTALVAMTAISAWQSVGLPMLLFYAALTDIPVEIYEAARCDGCSPWQTFRWISFPLVMPTIFTLSVLTFIWSFNVFDLAYALGGPTGSPGGALDVLGLLFYRAAFTGTDNALGSASAMATSLFVVLLTVTALLYAVRRRMELRA